MSRPRGATVQLSLFIDHGQEALRDLDRLRDDLREASLNLVRVKEAAARQAALLREEEREASDAPNRPALQSTSIELCAPLVFPAPVPAFPPSNANAMDLLAAWEALEAAEQALGEDWARTVQRAEDPNEVAELVTYSARFPTPSSTSAHRTEPNAELKDLLNEVERSERRLAELRDAVFVDEMNYERQRLLLEAELRETLADHTYPPLAPACFCCDF